MSSVDDSMTARSSEATARDVRAHAWAFAFECYRRKEGSHPGAPDDAKGSKLDRASKKYTG